MGVGAVQGFGFAVDGVEEGEGVGGGDVRAEAVAEAGRVYQVVGTKEEEVGEEVWEGLGGLGVHAELVDGGETEVGEVVQSVGVEVLGRGR